MDALAAQGEEVDLLIRTGGEKTRFLLWESVYPELLFTDRMWPDFEAADLDAALEEFSRRERRFGGVQTILRNNHVDILIQRRVLEMLDALQRL